MTIDKAKLKALAEAVAELEDIPERQDEHAEAVAYLETHMHCHTILGLIEEIDRLEHKNANQAESIREYQDLTMGGDVSLGMLKADLRVTAGERDQLKAENEKMRSLLAEVSRTSGDKWAVMAARNLLKEFGHD